MISFYRNGNWVYLETFSSKDIATYLNTALNANSEHRRFEVLAQPKWCKGILAAIDGTSFIIYANLDTYIELSFNVKDTEKMSDVIKALKKWDKFSQSERKYVLDFEDKETHITILENGYTSVESYQLSHFKNYKLTISEF